jgi:anti-sigma factor RsiW
LKEYHDGNLASGLTEQIAAHIETCAECAKELAFLQSYLRCTKEISMRKAPSQLAAKVDQKLLNSKRPRFSPLGPFWNSLRRLPVPVSALAGILLVIIFVFAANNSLKFAQNRQDKDLNSSHPAPYPAQAELKVAADDLRSSGQPADKEKAPAVSTRKLTGATGRANRINPPPVLTLIIKTPVSGNKKEAASMAAPESLRQLSKSAADESISETTGSSKSAETSQTASPPIIDNLQANLKAIIIRWGGKWVIPAISPGIKPAPELIFTLPAQNYQNFLAGIRQYGEVKQPYPSIDAPDQEIVTIKLQMVTE